MVYIFVHQPSHEEYSRPSIENADASAIVQVFASMGDSECNGCIEIIYNPSVDFQEDSGGRVV